MFSRRIFGLLRCGTGALAIGVVLGASKALADPADCAAIDHPEARLACYDRLHGRAETDAGPTDLPAEPDRPAMSPSPPPSMPAAASQKADATELTGEHVAEVVAVGESVTGRHWFRLNSGETWQQVTPDRTDIRAGDTVRVGASAIGTYHLRRADGSSRSSHVRRVQ